MGKEKILPIEKYHTSVKYYPIFTERLELPGGVSGSLAGGDAHVQGWPKV